MSLARQSTGEILSLLDFRSAQPGAHPSGSQSVQFPLPMMFQVLLALSRFLSEHPGRKGSGRGRTDPIILSPFAAEPRLSGHGVMVLPEDRLQPLCRGGRPAGRSTDDRCCSFSCVPEPLGLDPDPVKFSGRWLRSGALHLPPHSTPACTDKHRKRVRSRSAGVLQRLCPKRKLCRRCMEAVQKVEIPIARQAFL